MKQVVKRVVGPVCLAVGISGGVVGASTAHATTAAPATVRTQVSALSGMPQVTVWGSGVRVRQSNPPEDIGGPCWRKPGTRTCPVTMFYANPARYTALCQRQGQTVSAAGYTNDWWTYIEDSRGRGGWITNIYLKGGHVIAGVPRCYVY